MGGGGRAPPSGSASHVRSEGEAQGKGITREKLGIFLGVNGGKCCVCVCVAVDQHDGGGCDDGARRDGRVGGEGREGG